MLPRFEERTATIERSIWQKVHRELPSMVAAAMSKTKDRDGGKGNEKPEEKDPLMIDVQEKTIGSL